MKADEKVHSLNSSFSRRASACSVEHSVGKGSLTL
jgi:hypothetical protein